MRKLLSVSLLGVLLSIPSVVFAEASWYGSIRTGIESAPIQTDFNYDLNYITDQYLFPEDNPLPPVKTGVSDFDSRWGIQGSSEVSEGLTAVYRYERSIDSSNAGDAGGRLSYVGLSGGFGTVTVGKVWGAAYNHFGGIVDQALWYGSTGRTGDRFGNAVSYAVSVGNVSLQVDAIMEQFTGKTGDGFNFGATLGGLMETGSIAIAHRKHQDVGSIKQIKESSSFIAGNYGIDDMTVFLGYSQDSSENTRCINANNCVATSKIKITYAGVHGGVGDTGLSYVFAMRNEKLNGDGFKNGKRFTNYSEKKNPWTLGLSRSLGGGASVNFEHSEPDSNYDSSTAIWLQVDF